MAILLCNWSALTKNNAIQCNALAHIAITILSRAIAVIPQNGAIPIPWRPERNCRSPIGQKYPKHTSQKRTAQRTHCKKERHRAHIAMTIRSRAIAAQLVGSGQTANWRLEAKINFACSGKIFTFLQFCTEGFLGNILKQEKGGASYDQICISTLGPGNKRGTNTWWAKSFEEHLHPGLTTPAMDFKS